ncbi:MAG TPA: ribonuclease HII [bacterium]
MPWWSRTSPPSSSPRSPDALARAQGFRLIAGVDEAGRGPWAGPVVAAAVVLREPVRARIDDSKRLSPLQRARSARAILACADVGFGIVSADAIDRENIRRASLEAMRQAAADLSAPPELVLVDGRDLPVLPWTARAVVGGDRVSRVIAAASIMAKVLRDELMCFYESLYPGYAFRAHKGYGTERHAAALRSLGPSFLHRVTFRPVASASQACAPVDAVTQAPDALVSAS